MLATYKSISVAVGNPLTATQKSAVSGVSTAIALSLSFGFSPTMLAQDRAVQDYAALVQAHPGWVQIPGKLIRPDCVHEIPMGAKVELNGDKINGGITMGGQVIAHYDPCSEPAISTRPQSIATTEANTVPGTGNGWVEAVHRYVSLESGDNLDRLSGTWIVPKSPTETGGIIYLFNGIEPSANGSWLMQPVLQFGNNGLFGGNYWVIASWLVGPNNYAFHSTAEKVSSGDTIYGSTYVTSEGSGKLHYEVWAQDKTSGAYSWITVTSSGLQWNEAYPAVLEAYGISSCEQFPASSATIFENTIVDHGYPNFDSVVDDFTGWKNPSWTGPSCAIDPVPDGSKEILYYNYEL